MILWTAHYSNRHPARLDITRAGCDKLVRAGKPAPGIVLAPSADLLRWGFDARKRAKDPDALAAVWARYESEYLAEVEARIAADPRPIEALLRLPEVVFCCFCGLEYVKAEQCHRFPAARKVLVPRGADYRGEWPAFTKPGPFEGQMDLFGGGK